MREKTKRWWNGCSGREDPLEMGTDDEEVAAVERWDNAVVIKLLGIT